MATRNLEQSFTPTSLACKRNLEDKPWQDTKIVKATYKIIWPKKQTESRETTNQIDLNEV